MGIYKTEQNAAGWIYFTEGILQHFTSQSINLEISGNTFMSNNVHNASEDLRTSHETDGKADKRKGSDIALVFFYSAIVAL